MSGTVADFRRIFMSLVDDLIENLVERNAIDVNGTLTVTLVDGGIRIKGTVLSAVRDQRKNKQILKVDVPVDAQVSVGTIVIPLPQIK
jgi:ribosomal protein S3AE